MVSFSSLATWYSSSLILPCFRLIDSIRLRPLARNMAACFSAAASEESRGFEPKGGTDKGRFCRRLRRPGCLTSNQSLTLVEGVTGTCPDRICVSVTSERGLIGGAHIKEIKDGSATRGWYHRSTGQRRRTWATSASNMALLSALSLIHI